MKAHNNVVDLTMPCEQASNTLHHINRANFFKENSAMARLRDILKVMSREIENAPFMCMPCEGNFSMSVLSGIYFSTKLSKMIN